MTPAARAATLLTALPKGSFTGTATSRRYSAAKISRADGRSVKFEADELGGPDHISMNLYHLESGPCFRPCECSPDHALAFLAAFTADPDRPHRAFLLAPNTLREAAGRAAARSAADD